MLVLGIESSCDETGVAVVKDDGYVLSDVVHTQIDTHARYGGIVPELASRDHVRNIAGVLREALSTANVGLSDLDGIAVTNRPGLVGALLVGVQVAKSIAWGSEKPFVGVDHLVGHLLSVFVQRSETRARVPAFPFVCLLASGGHTAIYRVDAPYAESITELGGTRDDAAGEAFDKAAKLVGLGYPGGPEIDRLAALGNPKAIHFVAPMRDTNSLEFSFSGLKTQVVRWVTEHGRPKNDQKLADFCASFQGAVVSVLAQKVITAAEREGVRDVVLGGGVAANRELRSTLSTLAETRGLCVHIPPVASCTDNAAMIAYAGALELRRGTRASWDLAAKSKTVLVRATRKGRGARMNQ